MKPFVTLLLSLMLTTFATAGDHFKFDQFVAKGKKQTLGAITAGPTLADLEADAQFIPIPIVIDPATAGSAPSVIQLPYTVNGIDALLMGPGTAQNAWDLSERRPLVLIAPGNGYFFDEYTYLQEHLAKNGYFSATIGANGSDDSVLGRADAQMANLDFLYNAIGAHLTQDIALVGHSRGGASVVEVANRLMDQNNNTHNVDVEAVISLAPSGVHGDFVPELASTTAYLILYGAQDEDVQVAPAPGGITSSPFRLYDETFQEFTINSVVDLHKTMVYLNGGGHKGFSDRVVPIPNIGPAEIYMSGDHQRHMTKGYVNALLGWVMKGNLLYKPFIKEQRAIPSVETLLYPKNNHYGWGEDTPVQYTIQHSPRTKRTIDSFENGNPNTSSMGTNVILANFDHTDEDFTVDFEFHSPHNTRGLVMMWDEVGSTPWARWEIPGNQDNLSSYSYLTFRMAQLYGHILNAEGAEQSFTVWLGDLNGQFAAVSVADYGTIAYPDKVFLNGADISKTAMQTTTIPLADFVGVDLTRIKWVYIMFNEDRTDGVRSGAVILDSLQVNN